jgi:hypothetical protein
MNKLLFPLVVLSIILSGCVNKCPKDPKDISTEGCGDFFVYKKIQVDGFENAFITVQVMRDELALNDEQQTFDITNTPEITSKLEAFNSPYPYYCNDALDPSLVVLNEWTLISGTAEISIVRDRNHCTTDYVVDVILTNCVYEDAIGNQVTVSYQHFTNVLVGWYAG